MLYDYFIKCPVLKAGSGMNTVLQRIKIARTCEIASVLHPIQTHTHFAQCKVGCKMVINSVEVYHSPSGSLLNTTDLFIKDSEKFQRNWKIPWSTVMKKTLPTAQLEYKDWKDNMEVWFFKNVSYFPTDQSMCVLF